MKNNTNSGNDNTLLYVASFIFGISALLLCLVPILGLILGIIAIFINITAYEQKERDNVTNGLATAGLVTSAIGVIIATILSGVLTGLFIYIM